MCDVFEWTKNSYDLLSLVEVYEDQFPLIVKITGGFYGLETGRETVSKNEVLYLHCWSKHHRVVAKHSNGRRYFSIPASYPHTFTATKDGQHIGRGTLSALLDTNIKPINITLEDAQASLKSQCDPKKAFKFTDLIVTDEYDEKYVKANAISDGAISNEVSVIPCYGKAQMAVAQGLTRRSEQQWEDYKAVIAERVATIPYDSAKPNEDVILFTQSMVDDANSVYEHIEPSHYLSLAAGRKEQDTYDALQPHGETRHSDEDVVPRDPAPPRRRKSSDAGAIAAQLQRVFAEKKAKEKKPAAQPNVPPKPVKPSTPAKPTKDLSKKSKRCKFINSLEDVDEDISKLTIDEVGKCLSLLKLDAYKTAFIEAQVNGHLLKTFDEKILMEGFNMTCLNARKVIAFAKEGYRPV